MSFRKLSRRELLKGAGLAAVGTLLAACAPKTVEKVVKETVPVEQTVVVTEKETVIAPEHEKVTISWWSAFTTDTCKKVFPEVVKEFEDMYPYITVDFEISGGPPGGGDFMQVLLARIAAGNPPDTATLWSTPVQYAARGSLLAMDDFMAQAKWARQGSFFEGPIGSCQWRGKTYGLPASASDSAMFINTDKLKAKNLSIKREDMPKTWDDLKALSAEFVVYKGGDLKEIGFAPWTGISWEFPLWSALNGGVVYDPTQEQYFLNSDQNIEVFDYWLKWLEEQYKGDVEKFNAAGNWSGTYPDSGFAMQLAAMASDGFWAIPDAPIKVPFEVFDYPVGPSGKGTATAWWPNWWAMPKGCAHPPEAFLLCEWFATKGWERWLTYGAADLSAWKDFPKDIINVQMVDLLGKDRTLELTQYFVDYLAKGCPMWNSPVEDFATTTLTSALDETLHKTKTPKQALDEAQQLCTSKLQDALKG